MAATDAVTGWEFEFVLNHFLAFSFFSNSVNPKLNAKSNLISYHRDGIRSVVPFLDS